MSEIQATSVDSAALAAHPSYSSYTERAGVTLSDDDKRRAQMANIPYQPTPEFFKFSNQAHAYEITGLSGNLCIYEPLLNTPDTTIPIVCSFRGTSTLYDAYKDLNTFFAWMTGSSVTAIDQDIQTFANLIESRMALNPDPTVEFLGHSLGGLLSMLVFHELHKRNSAPQRLSRVSAFNPYLIAIPQYREIYDICSDPSHANYAAYRTQIYLHCIANDPASILAQTYGAFANVVLYPTQDATVIQDYTAIPYSDFLNMANHGLSNFIDEAFNYTVLDNPNGLSKDGVINIRTELQGSLPHYGINSMTSLYIHDNGTSVLKLNHPEVDSTLYEAYEWTYKGRSANANFDNFKIDGMTISFLEKFEGHTGTTIEVYLTRPEQYSQIQTFPIEGSLVMQQAVLGVGGTPQLVYVSMRDMVTGHNVLLPSEVLYSENLPNNPSFDRWFWRFDSTLYTHQGHRRAISPSTIPVLLNVKDKLTWLASYDNPADPTAHIYYPSVNPQSVLFTFTETHGGSTWNTGNIDGTVSTSTPPDEFIWDLVLQSDGTHTLSNTEQTFELNNLYIEYTQDWLATALHECSIYTLDASGNKTYLSETANHQSASWGEVNWSTTFDSKWVLQTYPMNVSAI